MLGAFTLREGDRLTIYATAAVRASLTENLGLNRVLGAFCGVEWREPSTNRAEPLDSSGGLLCRGIPLTANPPPYGAGNGGVHNIAYQLTDPGTGAHLLVAPDVGVITPNLREALEDSDVVLFDGTFWSNDELLRIKPSATDAGRMGHVTMKDGSLEVLSKLRAKHRIYIHINNTNPVLMPGSPEREAVERVGVTIGQDGQEFEL